MVLLISLIFSWFGATLTHGNWFGWTSNVLGTIGLGIGYIIVRLINDYVEG